jgi:hypothetical protein
MKTLSLLIITLSMSLSACEGMDGLPGAASVDSGAEAVGVDGGTCAKHYAATVWGDHWVESSGFVLSAGSDVSTLIVYLDDSPIPRACWWLGPWPTDSGSVVYIDKRVFPDANQHTLALSFGVCAVAIPDDVGNRCQR